MDEPNSGDASIWPRSYHGLYSRCRGGHHRTYREWTWDSLKNTQRDWTNIHQRFNRLTVFSDHNRKYFWLFTITPLSWSRLLTQWLWRNHRNVSAVLRMIYFYDSVGGTRCQSRISCPAILSFRSKLWCLTQTNDKIRHFLFQFPVFMELDYLHERFC